MTALDVFSDRRTPHRSDARSERRYFVLCASVALVALGAVLAVVPDPLRRLWSVGLPYGTGVGSVLLLLVSFEMIRERRAQPNAEVRSLPLVRRVPEVAVGFLALVGVVTAMTVFKTGVIGASGYRWDTVFAAADRAIFGTDPWRITHALVPRDWMTVVIDRLYHPFFLPMVLGYLLCLVLPGAAAVRRTYMGSYLVAWVLIGMGLAFAMVSAGPFYDGLLWGDGSTFAPLVARLETQQAEAAPLSALRLRGYLLAVYRSGDPGFGGGISAMPSMHVVLAALWAFAGWHLSRVLGVVLSLYTLLIWVGSVHLGWHYAVDGLFSFAVLAAIWWAVGRTVGLYPMRPRTPPV